MDLQTDIEKKTLCYGSKSTFSNSYSKNPSWVEGMISTEIGSIPKIKPALSWMDRVNSFRVRWTWGRMNYIIPPGLYAVGNPQKDSPVLVSANFKLSFDHLRKELSDRNVWILVLNTQGINVWCAAGKGTFSTEEILKQIQNTSLEKMISHRKLILPQLGAPGVRAHEAQKQSGFKVIYGPILAKDLPKFLDQELKASPEMRKIEFPLRARVVLIPVELVMGGKYALLLALILFFLSGWNLNGYSWNQVQTVGTNSALVVVLTFLWSILLGPLLLPVLPGRAFSIKGAILGFLLVGILLGVYDFGRTQWSFEFYKIAWILMIPAISSFTLMNFTGTSTFTSLSGVLREMKFSIPIQLVGAGIGFGFWITHVLIHGR